MLTQVVNKIGILFIVNFNGHDLHFQEWKATDDSIYYMPLSTMPMLQKMVVLSLMKISIC